MRQENHFVIGDWGTTQLRLNLATEAGIVERCKGAGIGALTGAPLATLLESLAPWRARHQIRDVYLCGMAGSRNGLLEVPYLGTPAAAGAWAAHAKTLTADGLQITIGAGLSGSNSSGAADVMRGEETQVFGALLVDPALAAGEHLLVLPGTHSKWVQLKGARIVRFDTYLTGELFALLRDHSTLLRTGGADEDPAAGFDAGLARTRSLVGGIAGRLFEARSAQLLQGRSRGWAEGFISGLLIGDEITAACSRVGQGGTVRIIGEPGLSALYRHALALFQVQSQLLDGDHCAIEGLRYLASHATSSSDKDPR